MYPIAVILQVLFTVINANKEPFAEILLILSGVFTIIVDFILYRIISNNHKIIRIILLVHGFVGVFVCIVASILMLIGFISFS